VITITKVGGHVTFQHGPICANSLLPEMASEFMFAASAGRTDFIFL
jgi:hypothetical protein